MRCLVTLLPVLLLLSPASASLQPKRPQPRSYDTHTYYALEIDPSLAHSAADTLSHSLGVELVEPIGELAGHWLVRHPNSHPKPIKHRSLTHLPLRQRSKRVAPPHPRRRSSPRDESELLYAQNELHLEDPMLKQQWHLINTEMPEVEVNVTGLWGRGITGTDVKVVIVDDGLDYESDDLKDNFYAEGSYDFNDHTELPKPRLSDDQHGTRCAGEIAAVPNDVCGVGVSYGAKIAGVRILSAPISDADEAAALNYAYQLNDIYSCSWGPPDDGKSMEAPEGLILKAMVNGVQNGRGGKGSVFVFAAGNGGGVDDQCNFDGYTNSIFSVTVGAVDRKGLHPYYSELCAAMMVVTPSSGSGDHIVSSLSATRICMSADRGSTQHTTDVGKDKCAHTHGGTSAAAPLAVGIFALALQVRPDLTWRDIQHLAVRNAALINPDDPDWEKTTSGRMFSYKYGYGRLDGGLFVEAAEKWALVKPQAWFDSPAVYLPTPTKSRRQDEGGDADDGDELPSPTASTPSEPDPTPTIQGTPITEDGISSTFVVTQAMLTDSNFEGLEHITVRVWIEHQRRGDVEVEIESPGGITSVLARQRRFDEADSGFPGWKFMSLKHWEENPLGTWTITVYDRINPEKTGRFIAWSLQLWGSVVDASLAKTWAPAEEGEPDEEETGSDPSPTSAVMTQKPKPTEHLPGDHGEAEGENDQPGLGVPGSSTDDADITIPTGDAEADIDEGFFDGIEGLSKHTTWLVGSGLIILILGSSVGVFLWLRARRRSKSLFGLANDGRGGAGRGSYEPISEDVPMGLLDRVRRKKKDTSSKELYDAFGDGPSDDEDEDGEEGADERTALRYHDDFLGDDDGEPSAPKYKDEPEPEKKDKEKEVEGEESTASSSSWQDAAEDVPRG
ncbi:kexin, partial [Tremellales sp. Uapishka_1]